MPRERARQGVWWPGLSAQLERTVKNCKECCKAQNQGALPLCVSTLPDLPFQKVGTDLFMWKGKNYLLVIDYFSRFIEIAKLTGTTAMDIINQTKSIFARHGIPETVISDNGPRILLQPMPSSPVNMDSLTLQVAHCTLREMEKQNGQ